jgi:hypothetical protein
MLVNDLETRVRTYLNEATAKFYTQAEIWNWLSVSAKDISEKTQTIRRILTSATGGAGVRSINTNAIVLHVEYIPSQGRSKILPKIDPLKIGNYQISGSEPQYWYPGNGIVSVEPLPDAIYNLRLYVTDVAKLKTTTTLATDWTGAGWTLGDSAIHAGVSSDLTYTPAITSGVNYTLMFNVTGISGTLKITAGTVEGTVISTNGYHTQNIVANGTTLKVTGVGDVTITEFLIYKEAAISAGTQELELGAEWDHLLALYATYSGLLKDRQYAPANLLASIYPGELDYLRRTVVEVIPDGRDDMVYQ